MNFSIHLPDPLLSDLDRYARSHQISRSGVVREAVQQYLARQAGAAWPDDLTQWMSAPAQPSAEAGPDFELIRAEMNQSIALRAP